MNEVILVGMLVVVFFLSYWMLTKKDFEITQRDFMIYVLTKRLADLDCAVTIEEVEVEAWLLQKDVVEGMNRP